LPKRETIAIKALFARRRDGACAAFVKHLASAPAAVHWKAAGPRIRVTFGTPLPTAGLPLGKETTMAVTRQLQAAIAELRSVATAERSAA